MFTKRGAVAVVLATLPFSKPATWQLVAQVKAAQHVSHGSWVQAVHQVYTMQAREAVAKVLLAPSGKLKA